MNLAKRVEIIKESPTFTVMGKASKMKKNGLDVTILAAGEPDFDTPKHIKEAAIKAIQNGKTKYTPAGGSLELKQAVADKFLRENQLNYSLNEVIISCGAKHSIFNSLQAILNDGDEVIIPAPYWVSYPDMVLLCGGIPVPVTCSYENSYKLTVAQLEQAISPKTKAIIINSPSNPTGMVYSAEELSNIAKVLEKYPNIYIISDDIYEHILFDNNKFNNIVNVAPELKNRTIVINGVSKAYAMTGWRIGFAACSNMQLIKAIDTIQSQSTSNPCSISQEAAIAALNGGHHSLKEMHTEFSNRHQYVVNRINQIEGLTCLRAQGAFYAFFECSKAIEKLYNQGKIAKKNDLAFANYLLENFLVAGVPGSAFGLDNHMRFSFATNITELTKGLNNLEKALS